ncbi:MAG: hypothetical protein A3E83_04705 [Gammaproteobacteria bacterium RIFCSPHIGHO2_12_FULL_41_20]|nr:MAG: hypothetical protein A3E83_04705 [Gammaproteobacteria bacterium RIFCSPHIGHO2_12_FULL_41_20]
MKKILFFIITLTATAAYALPSVATDYSHLLFTLMSFFGLGILLAFTPCILPMVPILSGILVGQKNTNTFFAFKLSLVFVLGMAVTYALAGVAAGYLGSTIQTFMQSPWIITSFSLIFVAMALSMFGLFNLRVPKFILMRAQYLSEKQKSGTLWGVALMGVLSTLIASPCITAPMISVLTYISQTGNALLGGLILFTLSLGMGLPLILFGIGQGVLLPKAGAWMEKIKNFFGVIMLGLAIWMMSRLLPEDTTNLLWAMLIITSSVGFGALDFRYKKEKSHVIKGLSVLGLIYGMLLTIGIISGKGDFLHPLQITTAYARNQAIPTQKLFYPISNLAELQQQLSLAKSMHKPAMIEFYASWCPDCRALDKNAFSNLRIQQLMQSFLVMRVDITHDNAELKQLRDRYHVYGVPSIIFYDKTGNQIAMDLSQEPSKDLLEEQLTQISTEGERQHRV